MICFVIFVGPPCSFSLNKDFLILRWFVCFGFFVIWLYLRGPLAPLSTTISYFCALICCFRYFAVFIIFLWFLIYYSYDCLQFCVPICCLYYSCYFRRFRYFVLIISDLLFLRLPAFLDTSECLRNNRRFWLKSGDSLYPHKGVIIATKKTKKRKRKHTHHSLSSSVKYSNNRVRRRSHTFEAAIDTLLRNNYKRQVLIQRSDGSTYRFANGNAIHLKTAPEEITIFKGNELLHWSLI